MLTYADVCGRMLTHVHAAGLNAAQASRDTGKASNKHTAIRNSRGGGGAAAAAERADGLQVFN
jgi:hypothetical protein